MALPSGISTCTVTVGSSGDFFGGNATISVQVRPILGGNAKRITWAAGGQTLASFSGVFTGDAGAPATFTLPHVDQDGFRDGSGNAFKNWSYLATVTITNPVTGETTSYDQAFQLLVGQTTVDLDLVPDGSIGSATTAPVLPVSSINGRQGAVNIGALSGVAATATSAGALSIGKVNPVDASGGALTMTLAAADGSDRVVVITKTDASANAVTLNVANLRGSTGSLSLVGQWETYRLESKADGSWWVVGDHRTKTWFDATYARKGATGRTDIGLKTAARYGATAATPPSFSRANGGSAIFSVATQNPTAGALSPTTSSTIYWPCVIDARAILGGAALDEFYLYYSTDHDSGAGGIWLATAPSELGPWTGRGRVYVDTSSGSQSETPTVIADPTGANKLLMFYQQNSVSGANGVQSTCIATSNDGVTWARQTFIDIPSWWPADGHTGYWRVHAEGGSLYAHSLTGGGNQPSFGLWHSYDGRSWTLNPKPLTYQMDLLGDGRRVEWNSGDIIWWNGRHWWIGMSSDFVSGATPKDGRIIIAAISDDFTALTSAPQVLLYPINAGESTDYRAIQTFQGRDGRLYLYYQCGGSVFVAIAEATA